MPNMPLRNIQIRPATQKDVDDLLQLLRPFDGAWRTVDELQTHWQALNLDKQTRVATTSEGLLIGYAELLQRQATWFTPKIWIQADYQRRGLGKYLLQIIEAQIPSLTNEVSVSLSSQIVGKLCAADYLLEKAGYITSSIFQIRELLMTEVPLPSVTIPDIEIRPFALEQDVQFAYKADEEAFLDERGYEPRTFEQWSSRLHIYDKDFDPNVCFLAWDGEVIVAGIYTTALAEIGDIMHVGVRRPWRKRGIAEALMRHSLREYYKQGIYRIHLNVDGESLTKAQLLYERMGFHVINVYRNYICQRSLLAT